MSVLTLTYRPVTFSGVVGQRHVLPVLAAMVRKDEMVPALIFHGERGTGKTTVARILAAALNCEQPNDGDACGECVQCQAVQSTGSDAVLEVDAASNGGVAEVERIRNLCLYAHTGRWRVVVLDEAHSMSRDAFNALLKMLEEPPPNTVFVLLTTEADKILGTVRSRSMSFEFRRITYGEIVDRLGYIATREGIPHDEDLLAMIATDAQGGLRDAVMLLDQCSRADVKDTQGYTDLRGRVDLAMPLLDALTLGENERAFTLLGDYFVQSGDLVRLVDDITGRLVECARCMAGVSGLEVAGIVQRMSGTALVKALKVVWDVRERAAKDPGDPVRLGELMVALLAQALGSAYEGVVPATAEPKPILRAESRLSVEETLAELARLGVLEEPEDADLRH